jgi:calcium/calmodulin-dependent protein kinase I
LRTRKIYGERCISNYPASLGGCALPPPKQCRPPRYHRTPPTTPLPANKTLDLKPENLLYLTREADSPLVLADFGIAKMLDSKDEVLTTMAGSFGYAAPEVMLKRGHGKPVDIWSLGVITYTLLCGYSPFRSENLADLIDECQRGRPVFHERYWKEVSKDAKEFIGLLLQPNPANRPDSEVIS